MKEIKSGLSILWQLIIAGIILTTLVIILFTYYLISNERHLVMEQAKLRAMTVSSFVSLMLNQSSRVEETLVDDITSKNINTSFKLKFLSKKVLQNVIELAQFHYDIKSVEIIDHNFYILASYPYGKAGKINDNKFIRLSLAGQQLPRTQFTDVKGETFIEITVPLVVYGSIAGTMDMVFTTEYLNKEIESIIKSSIIIAIIFIIIQSVIISIFAKIFTNPILNLADRARKISEGDNRIEIPITRKDEIGYLQSSFKEAIHNQNLAIDTLNQTNTAYRRFIPREFLNYLNRDSIIEVQLGDQIKKEMTVLFSDIRSFTTLSESMNPKENFNFLNEYLMKMGPIIRLNNGFIDKYIGDAIMALFPDKADDAVNTAVEMFKTLSQYNMSRVENNEIPIDIGIGIHTGDLMLGTIGESERMETTVIADAVNLSSRLEGLTKKYKIKIAISRNVIDRMHNPDIFHFRFVDKVLVKGKKQSVDVYEVYNSDPCEIIDAKNLSKNHYDKGIELFYNREFEKATEEFKKVIDILKSDTLAQIYYDRSINYSKITLPEDWSGIEVLQSK